MAARLQVSRVQKKGQVTIPVAMRESLGLKEGDLVAFVQTDDGVLITSEQAQARKRLNEVFDAIGAALKEKGITLEELIESGREIRGEIAREKYGLVDEP